MRKKHLDDVIADFRKTDLYSEEFLKDIEDGLKKSPYKNRLEHLSKN